MPLEGRERPRAGAALRSLGGGRAIAPAPSRAATSASGSVCALAGRAVLDLDLAGGSAARPDDHLPGQADQVGGGELAAGALVGVVVEHVRAGGRQRRVEFAADAVAVGVAGLQVDQRRRRRARPLPAR